jgi:hypothetical protein
MELYCTPKSIHYSLIQSATLGTHVHVRPARSRNNNSYRILPTGPLVAMFQHSLPFLQSESFQTHVGTIHRRAIGPFAHHNGTSAYSPSLTCHLPAPTIGCLHSNDSLTTLTSTSILEPFSNHTILCQSMSRVHRNICLLLRS